MVDLLLPKGAIMGLIGENGAGKSTALKAMLDIVRRDSGAVEILGLDLDTDQQLLDYMRRFALPGKKKIKEYSKGMQIKLSIAAALSHHPRLLILDEATSGLDPVVRDEILDILFGFIQDGEHSVLISSHITSDLDKVADYVTMIHNGSILFSEEKDTLIEDMGIIKCSQKELKTLTDLESRGGITIVGVRQSAYQSECLVRRRRDVMERYPALVMDRTNIEEIMLFYVRGQIR